MSKKNILIIGIAVLVILGVFVYFWKINKINPNSSSSPAATETSKPQITSTSNNSISDWQEYNSNLTTTYLFKDLKAPFLFKYPKEWNLDEGLSGIQIYSFDGYIGYEIGTVPKGKFMIQILPDIEDKNNEEIKSWCKNNLYDSPVEEFLSEKYIEVDGNKSYLVDYKMRSGNFDSLRQVCIAKSDLKVIIYAEPLDANYLGIFDKILSTFKFIENDTVFFCGTSTVKDVDGNLYKTVKIGSQCWMKENIKVTKNPEGKVITRYCYNNDLSICKIDGGLYDWNTAMDSSNIDGARGICPNGWHIPKDSEWYALESGLATGSCDANRSGWGCNLAGMNLKQNGSSGFEGIFAGYRAVYPGEDGFYDREKGAYFWSSTKSMPTERGDNAIGRYLNSQSMVARSIYDLYLPDSFSIRCLKD